MERFQRRAWDPWQELLRLQEEVGLLFDANGFGVPFLAERSDTFPRVNIWTTESESIVHAEVPGVPMEDLDVTIVGTTLTLKGARKPAAQVPHERHYRHERRYGTFGRSVQLPHKVDADKVTATLEDGILSVRLPKAPEVKPRKVMVKS